MTRDSAVFLISFVCFAFWIGLEVGQVSPQQQACTDIAGKRLAWETSTACGYVKHSELYGKAVWIRAKREGVTK